MFTTLAPFLLTISACGLAFWTLGRAAELERAVGYWRALAMRSQPAPTMIARQFHSPRAGTS